MSFASDLIGLAGQALVFAFIGEMIDPDQLPTFQGKEVTYLEFAAIGIALGVFITFGLQRVSTAIRNEQLMGTLESLLVSPTRTATLQIGSVFFDLIYVPLQTALFLAVFAFGFGLHLEPTGIFPATAVLLVFIPFVWGLGVLSAAATLTFRRGTNAIAIGTLLLALAFGLYFPGRPATGLGRNCRRAQPHQARSRWNAECTAWWGRMERDCRCRRQARAALRAVARDRGLGVPAGVAARTASRHARSLLRSTMDPEDERTYERSDRSRTTRSGEPWTRSSIALRARSISGPTACTCLPRVAFAPAGYPSRRISPRTNVSPLRSRSPRRSHWSGRAPPTTERSS